MGPRHVLWMVVLLALSPAAVAAEASVSHEPPVCFRPAWHASILASLPTPAADVSASVVFRQEGTLFWYEARFAAHEGRLLAVLPPPARAGMSVEYALVVCSPGELQWRSGVFVVPVQETCATPEAPLVRSARTLVVLRDGGAPEKPPGFDMGDMASQVLDRTTQLDPESRAGTRPHAPPQAGPLVSVPDVDRGGTGSPTQSQPLLSPPARVRLRLRGSSRGEILGQLLEVQQGGLVVRPQGQPTSRLVAFETIERVQTSNGRRSRTWRYASYGGLLVLAGVSVARRTEPAGVAGFVWGLALSPIGVGLGAVVGAASPAELWQDVPESTWIRPERRVSVRFSVGF